MLNIQISILNSKKEEGHLIVRILKYSLFQINIRC